MTRFEMLDLRAFGDNDFIRVMNAKVKSSQRVISVERTASATGKDWYAVLVENTDREESENAKSERTT